MKVFKPASVAALALAVAMLGTSCVPNTPVNNPNGYETTIDMPNFATEEEKFDYMFLQYCGDGVKAKIKDFLIRNKLIEENDVAIINLVPSQNGLTDFELKYVYSKDTSDTKEKLSACASDSFISVKNIYSFGLNKAAYTIMAYYEAFITNAETNKNNKVEGHVNLHSEWYTDDKLASMLKSLDKNLDINTRQKSAQLDKLLSKSFVLTKGNNVVDNGLFEVQYNVNWEGDNIASYTKKLNAASVWLPSANDFTYEDLKPLIKNLGSHIDEDLAYAGGNFKTNLNPPKQFEK